MSARARQSHRLAADLAEHLGVPVEFVYTGEPDRRGAGAWRVHWTDGPTPATMKTEAARRAERYPAVDVEHLGWSRSSTDLAQAAALLAWLPQHPDYFGYLVSLYVVDSAFDAVDFPERLEEPILRRARALLQLEGWVSMTALQQLSAHCAPGWEHVEQWLDELAGAAEARSDGTVVDLAAARDRRSEQR